MKRAIVIALALIYTVSCFGMTASRFYCCGKLASVSVAFGIPGKIHPDKNKCCKTEKLSFKIKDNHVVSNGFIIQPVAAIDVPAQVFQLTTHQPVEREVLQVHSGNSPPRYKVAIYTFNCAYRI